MEEIVKKYLEEHCATDSVLAEKFNPELMPECYKFIYKMAEEMHGDSKSECLAIERTTVFKWARDFFIEGEAALEEERKAKQEKEAAERKAAQEKAERERMEKERYEREHANGQITIFDFAGV